MSQWVSHHESFNEKWFIGWKWCHHSRKTAKLTYCREPHVDFPKNQLMRPFRSTWGSSWEFVTLKPKLRLKLLDILWLWITSTDCLQLQTDIFRYLLDSLMWNLVQKYNFLSGTFFPFFFPNSCGMLGLGLWPATCYEIAWLDHKLPAPMSGFTVPYFAGQTNDLLLQPPYFTVAEANCYNFQVSPMSVANERTPHFLYIKCPWKTKLPKLSRKLPWTLAFYPLIQGYHPNKIFIHQLLQIF